MSAKTKLTKVLFVFLGTTSCVTAVYAKDMDEEADRAFEKADCGKLPECLTDDAAAAWDTDGAVKWAMADLGAEHLIGRWKLRQDTVIQSDAYTKNVQFQVWTGEKAPAGSEKNGDGLWKTVDCVNDNGKEEIDDRTIDIPVTARYIRIYITKNDITDEDKNRSSIREPEISASVKTEIHTILDTYKASYTEPPVLEDVGITPDAPLLGNGDTAVAVGGNDKKSVQFFISKSDLNQSTRGVGKMLLSFKGEAAADGYLQEQDMYCSLARSTVALTDTTINMTSWVSDDANALITELANVGGADVKVDLTAESHGTNGAGISSDDGIIWVSREMSEGSNGNGNVLEKPAATSRVAIASRVIGASAGGFTADGIKTASCRFTLTAGGSVYVITFVGGGRFSTTNIEDAIAGARAYTADRIITEYQHHLEWWKNYWEKSYIRINDDPLLERFYYGALYSLGCGSRKGAAAPGLTGPWGGNGKTPWGNRYTLDYNFQSLWWGVYSSSRAELALPFYDVNLKLIPAAQIIARTAVPGAHNFTSEGILFPVNALAWGQFADERTLNMKSNALLSLLNFMMHYEYTQDDEFLLHTVWPMLKEIELFWSDDKNNLIWDAENERWYTNDSGAREGSSHMNAINDLSYLTHMYRFLLRYSDVLEGKLYDGEKIHFSDERKAGWKDRLDHMSGYPTMKFGDVTVWKEAENMNRMTIGGGPGDNTDVLMGIYPGGVISMSSDPELLETAKNTVDVMINGGSWQQKNSVAKVYNQAIRAGYSADITMDYLRRVLKGDSEYLRKSGVHLFENNTIISPEHGWESIASIESINAMMLQSHDYIIRVFPNWLSNKDGFYHDLAAYGGFTVSSEIKDNVVSYVNIRSNAGKICQAANPWQGSTVRVYDVTENSETAARIEENIISFETSAGHEYKLIRINSSKSDG